MKTLMDFTISTTCPIDGETIPIAVTIEPRGFLTVEQLLKVANMVVCEPITQEDFTTRLAHTLPVKSLQTIGTHSGVKITCLA